MKLQQSIHATFSALAVSSWDRTALIDDDQRLTYGELARRSDDVAHYLWRHGIRLGDRVGLYSQRSVDAVTVMLGILKAGAAYVPFDPSYPANLLRFVYEDCAPKLMLVQASLAAAPFWQGEIHDIHAVCTAAVGATAPGDTAAQDPPDTLPAVGADDAAYLMYTSGSTGRPKGVLVPHRGVVRLVIDNPFAEMGPEQTHLQLAPLAFDACTFEIWGALLNGGRLAIVSTLQPSLDDIAANIARHGVTTLWLTAGLFHLMVDHRLEGLRPLQQLLAGGDVLSPSHIAKVQQALPHCQLINGYGPTENTTFTCCYRIPPGLAPGAIPIGTPIAQTQVYVLDATGQPVADGQEGELFCGGAGVALGYWNRPELTAERFVKDSADPTGRATCYRTGDRVRRRRDGNIEFLGRVDRQVKINGKRVELDEIEAHMRRHPAVEDAAVTSPAAESGGRKVHAYLKLFSNNSISVNDIRSYLKKELPDYMLPATFTVLDVLPLSPTGKVDRSKLPAPAPVEATAAAVTEPATAGNETEARIAAIWRDVLGVNAVGVNDNFFDLGGTSLQLIAVLATITSTMGSDVTMVDLFQYPRISALAARMRRAIEPAHGDTRGLKSTGTTLSAEERARRQQGALARARAVPRRSAR